MDLWLAAGFHRLRNASNAPVARVQRAVERYRGGTTRPVLLSIDRPRFPLAGAQLGVPDSVQIEFVVDSSGLVIPESIRPIRASFREYADAAMRAVRTARFAPARIGRCAVPARLVMPVHFLLGG